MTLKPRSVWCRHIIRVLSFRGNPMWTRVYQDGAGHRCMGKAQDYWRFCPICGTPRPTRKGAPR